MADLPNQDILWKEFKQGNRPAFSVLYRHHYPSLYFYARKSMDDQELAQECVQELFVTLWQSRARLGDVISVKPYLFKALRGILHRQRISQKKYSTPLYDDCSAMEFSPEDFMIQQEDDTYRQAMLTTVLNRLPNQQREAIYLKYYENLSYLEIAEVLQINYQSVVNLIYQAFQRLRQQPQLQNLSTRYHAYE